MSYNSHRYNGGYRGNYNDKRYKSRRAYHPSPYYDKELSYGRVERDPEYRNGVRQHDSSHSSSNSTPVSTPRELSRVSSKMISGSKSSVRSSLSDLDTRPNKQCIKGTHLETGVNEADQKFEKLLLHSDNLDKIAFYGGFDEKKNYKVMYDPELDKTLSKEERKAKAKKIRFHGDGIEELDVKDPRRINLIQYFLKPNKKSKKFPFKLLPQPRFVYDEDSLGEAPQTELVIWDLPSTTSELYLKNFIRSYGDSIKVFQFLNDPINAVPLGIAKFKFQGTPDKSMKLAKQFIKRVQEENPKIDGVDLKLALNDNNDVLLQSKVKVAQNKIRISKQKREEEEKRRQKELDEARRKEELKRREELRKKEKLVEEPVPNTPTFKSHILKVDLKPNSTILSVRSNNKVINGVLLPKDIRKVVKDRPYIIIRDKYIPTRKVPSQDIKRAFNKYGWTRVLLHSTGFYVVFNSLKECERCFINEDGKRFYEYRLFMELSIPEGYIVETNTSRLEEANASKGNKVDDIDEAVNMLMNEFQTFLSKDIRERIIAPTVLDLLSHDKYPHLIEDLKKKEEETKSSQPAVNSSDVLKQNARNVLAMKKMASSLPSFKKREEAKNGTISLKKKKHLIPMQRSLNFVNDSDDSDEESSRSITPISQGMKRERSVTSISTINDDSSELPTAKKHKKTELRKSLLYDSSSSDDEEMKDGGDDVGEIENIEVAPEENEEDVGKREDEDEEPDYTNVDLIYQPTEGYPRTVYEEAQRLPNDVFDLDMLQDLIKDEEDLRLANKVLSKYETGPSEVGNIEYWAWKQKDSKMESLEIAEDVDLIEQFDSSLDSKSGAFRSEGFRKIKEAEKIQYLPLRRKIHKPIKTVQHDDDDINGNANTGNNNNIQSSRVNRANNRRFAADVSAQLGSETEALSLNALTKRKKPVTFARSAIHNWGLYALEPIAAKEMIIEYVGELIRQQVAEHREKSYLKTGIGSSYLFRVDENTVIDATKKGGIARFINHCCDPSCTAKIIKVEGQKRIVIYALRDIDTNEELTYDYKFERETNDAERIKCLCGAPGCKGYLN